MSQHEYENEFDRKLRISFTEHKHARPFVRQLMNLYTFCNWTLDEGEFYRIIDAADSPIECLFLGAICARHWRLPVGEEIAQAESIFQSCTDGDARCRLLLVGPRRVKKGVFAVQVSGLVSELGNARHDFVHARPDARFIIELDGVAYHSAPDRMVADRARDRVTHRAGWQTLRFTGSDIIDDALQRFDEVTGSVDEFVWAQKDEFIRRLHERDRLIQREKLLATLGDE